MKKLLIIYCCVSLFGCAHYDSGHDAIGAMLGMNIKSNEEKEEGKCYDSGYYSVIDEEISNTKKDYFLENIYKPYNENGSLPYTNIIYISRLECDSLTRQGIVNRYASLLKYVHQKSIFDEQSRKESEKIEREKFLEKEKEDAALQEYLVKIHSISFSDTEDTVRNLFRKAKSYCNSNISRYANGEVITQLVCKNPNSYDYMYYYFVNGKMSSMQI
ncbi:TPA: hypothetical protein RI762_003531 [Vibrio cholerae]|uniref:hypothetical protein n=1 Tax=Vibrio TaxID=662 RepID=UPI000157D8FC|nr:MULTISPECIES: hypothetical protein [Vibrio]EGR0571118.1 hypothetical protein [Vibrio cholerae]EGR4218294.1 hypothetical protein [Vibrio cholerae]EGR4255236.1 hypothetical protein [Vibrio cholerae]EGR4303548.1 hypothetical protein [Vibrio cholerae]EGR4344480.1 hypothetical protein [Vibrio cholerae]